MNRNPAVAVVGATGVVGREMLAILEGRRFPLGSLRLLASSRSAGMEIVFRGTPHRVEELREDSFRGVDIALFSAGSAVSRRFVPVARRAGAVSIDNTSAFRMDPAVPLVVPEVNPDAIPTHNGILANPNCSTIQMVVVLAPLHRAAGLRRVVVATYQAVSGAGTRAIEELRAQSRAILDGGSPESSVFPHPIAFNALPQIPQSDAFREEGYTEEEWKMIRETRKILALPDLPVAATCVRIAVARGHSEVVHAAFDRDLSPEEARRVLSEAPGVEVLDRPEDSLYPMPITAAGRDPTYVGRIRRDLSCDRGIVLWIVADNLRKGAALNAVQIAESLSTWA